MSHVEEGTIQAWIDGELGDSDLSAVESHAASCAVCQAEVRSLHELSARSSDLLADYGDLPIADFGTLGQIRKRARRPRHLLPVSLARAAMLLFAFAGLVAATIPGSPLRRWIEGTVLDRSVEPAPGVVESPVATPQPTRRGGVFVRPERGEVTIRLNVAASSELMVRLVDGAEAGVVWSGPDAGVHTRQTAGLLEVSGLPGGLVTVTIPKSAIQARVEVGGQVWWVKSGSDVRIPGPARDERGDEVVFQPVG